MSTIRYSFHVKRAAAGAPKRLRQGRAAPVPDKVPRIARLLALAHKFQGMLDRGEVESMADLARLGRVSRARITQIMDLLMLAPEIQASVLLAGDHSSWRPRDLIALAQHTLWQHQRAVASSPSTTGATAKA